MPTIRYDQDASLEPIRARRVAIVGYGSQGHAHALNLKESGVEVKVALREGSRRAAEAKAAGLEVTSVEKAAKWANVVMILAPDTIQPKLFRDQIRDHLKPGDALAFAHGFNIRYGTIEAPKGIDVFLVAPKGPGHRVRETFVEGGGVPALLAVHQDASGKADELALSYAKGIGATRAGVINTTFTEETETDLFGEQAVLCGGVSELVKAGFHTLVNAGYQPEIAYFECLHELKLIVDLMYRGGLSYMRYSVSDTAEWGDYESGPKIITDETRAAMKKMLGEIQDGTFAARWIKETQDNNSETLLSKRRQEQNQLIEKVGRNLRDLMPFVQPVKVSD